jgi:predicted Zn-dependent protease
MRKFVTVFLLLIIVGSFGFAFIRFQANDGDQQNWFNQHGRSSFAQSSFLRSAFGLHWDGDGQYMYLSARPPALTLVVHAESGRQLTENVKNQLVQNLTKVVQKSNGVQVIDGSTVSTRLDSYSREQVRALASQSKFRQDIDNSATLHIFLLSRFTDTPSNIGMTVREDGVVVFMDAIADLTQSNQASADAYILSTILHEFGHQLGLGHVDSPDCIMASEVENPQGYFSTPTQYCSEELQLIETQRAKYQ